MVGPRVCPVSSITTSSLPSHDPAEHPRYVQRGAEIEASVDQHARDAGQLVDVAEESAILQPRGVQEQAPRRQRFVLLPRTSSRSASGSTGRTRLPMRKHRQTWVRRDSELMTTAVTNHA